jgi:hypothetical protein
MHQKYIMDIKEFKINNLVHSMMRHPWEKARAYFTLKLIDNFTNIPNDRKINVLDIGCGDTYVIQNIGNKYKDAVFFAVDTAFTDEIIEDYISKYKNKYSLNLFKDLDKASSCINADVDIVLLLDVLEHIEDEKSFLNLLKTYPFISKSTFFIITVPAFQSLFSSHDVFLDHFRRYNKKSLKKLINECGFSIVKQGYFFSSLLVPRFFSLLFQKNIKKVKQKGVSSYKANKLFDLILFGILTLDYKISLFLSKLGINIIGLSNYILCKKTV